MKKLSFLLCLALSVGLQAQDESEIHSVTVFTNAAQVHRSSTVNMKKGENVFHFEGLSSYLIPNSIQVNGSSNFTILTVNSEMNYTNDGIKKPEYLAKMDSIKDLNFTIGMRESIKRVYQEEKALVTANRSIKGSDGVLLAEDLQEMADFFRSRLREIEFKILEVNDELAQMYKDLQRMRDEAQQMGISENLNRYEVVIKLDSKKSGNEQVEFSYRVAGAGWYPIYDIRTENIDKEVELRYKAQVYQNTGNDWNRVQLTLSTGNPSLGGQAPEIHPWYLHAGEEVVYRKRILSQKQNARYDMKAEAEPMESLGYNSMDVEVVENVFLTEFDITIPFTIPSDNLEKEVEIKRHFLPADYRYFSIPKLDQDAFLQASITDFQSLHLLPGESQIYFNGTFVGKSYLDPMSTQDTLNLSLGRDQNIVIERKMIKEFCKTQNIGFKKKTSKAYRIIVKNQKSTKVSITLEDQIPMSKQNDLEINVEEISGAKYDEETGKLTWELDIEPGQSKELMIQFNVKYPKKMVLYNL